jgi:MinD-like ATPase involved in chromosome partitioning or flagellar assembly/Tfp pilus assembly protein PilF
VAGLFDLLMPRKAGDRLERALQDGERYLRERQFAAAEQAFDFAAREYPADPRIYLGLAALHRARGQESGVASAFVQFRDAVRALPASPDEQAAWLARGYGRLGDHARALDAWQAVLAANPESVEAHHALAEAAEAAAEPQLALEHLAWLTDRFPHEAAHHRAASRLRVSIGDVEAAAAARQRALELAETGADRVADTFELGRLHRQLGQLDAALAELSTCATLDPNWPDVQRELGHLHLQRAAWGEARRAFETYVALAPNAPDRADAERQVAMLAEAPEAELETTQEIQGGPALTQASTRSAALAPLLVVFGLQGGVGRTTLMANLALLMAQRGERVALLDLANPAPELALHLGLQPQRGLAELSRELGENRLDWHAVSRAAVAHEAGVSLLVGCTSPITSELVTDSLLQHVLPMLQLNYGWILADTAPDVGERSIYLLERARLVLIVASPDAPGYQAARGALQVCETLHLPASRRRIVWHATRGQPSGPSDIIAHRFPAESHRYLSYAGEEFRPEVQAGRPLVLRKPQHRWARELKTLADEFAV